MRYIDYNIHNENIIRFETFEVFGKYIYTQVIDKNILVRFNFDESEIEIVNTDDDYRFKQCTRLNNKLYFADNLGEALVEYDIKHNFYKTYDMNWHIKNNNNIAAIEEYGEKIFIVGQYKGALFIFDTKNKILEKEEALEKKIKDLYGSQEECIIRCWKIDECLYLIVNSTENYYIFKYDMIKNTLQELSENEINHSMRNAYCFENKLYILKNDFILCIWDIKSYQTQTIEMHSLRQIIEGSNLKYKYAFNAFAITKRNIWLFPAGENEDIYIYDLSKKTAQKYDKYPSDFSYLNRKGWSKYGDIKEREGFIYVAARLSNYYLMIDIEMGKEYWKRIGSCDFSEYYQDVITKRIKKEQVIYEQSKGMFCTYLSYYQKLKYKFEEDCNIGNRIWEALK